MENISKQLRLYMLEEFPSVFMNPYSRELLENILTESEKIQCVAERCEWLAKMLPEISLGELRNVMLR